MIDHEILTEDRNRPARRSRRWIVALSVIPFFGMVAAFGIAPGTQVETITQRSVVDELELRMASEERAPALALWQQEVIQKGDTVGTLLSRLGVDNEDVVAFLQSVRGNAALRRLVPGKTVKAQVTEHGQLLAFRYLDGTNDELVVDRSDEGFMVRTGTPAVEQRVVLKAGRIESSLFAATDAAEIPDAIAIQMAEIFGSDIDFHRDIRKGDRFIVIYEAEYYDGALVRSGRILAAEFVNDGKTYQAIYFSTPEGSGYYSPDGKSLKKAFLRSPLPFSRITSKFTLARFHPIFKEWRAHRGVDYGAPVGTPVRATGNGRVAFAGKQGGYGNIVIIQHAGGYSTAYAHLSGFAKGIRPGVRVEQGQTIGYVGMTGWATGPHLHYEFRVNGVQRDPLKVAMPEAPPIGAQHRAAFKAAAAALTAQMDLMRSVVLAQAE